MSVVVRTLFRYAGSAWVVALLATAIGALFGAIAGAVILFLVQWYGLVNFWLYPAVGIVSCFVVGYLVSLLDTPRQRELAGLTVYTID